MLCGGVAACHRYGGCTVRVLSATFVICYAVVSQHVIGMVCVLFAVLSATFVICYVVVWQHVIGMVCVLFSTANSTHTIHKIGPLVIQLYESYLCKHNLHVTPVR